MFTGMTQGRLAEALGRVEPVRLLGLDLLRQHQPNCNDWFPTGIETEALAEATADLIDYTSRCRAARARLEQLAPLPLTGRVTPEFPL